MTNSGNDQMGNALEQGSSNEPASAHLEPQKEETKMSSTRRSFLATMTAGAAALAGCNDGQTEDPLPNGTPGTDTPGTQTEENTPTETEEPEPEIDTIQEVDADFEEEYRETYDQDQNSILTEQEVGELQQLDTKIDQIERAAEILIDRRGEEWENLGPQQKINKQIQTEITEKLREITDNQLGYNQDGINDVIIRDTKAGDYQDIASIFTKNDNGDWEKHLGKWDTIRKNNEPLQERPETEAERVTNEAWEQDNPYQGMATSIHVWRDGVEKGNTLTRLPNEKEILGGFSALDHGNDSIIVNENKEIENWGEIGYSREVSNLLVDIQDLDENDVFNKEVELMRNLTEFYHGEYEAGPNNFIAVATGQQLEEDMEEGLAEDAYELVEINDKKLYASEVNLEQHKEDTWNIQIPENKWPERDYPGNVSLPERLYEDDT
jgi:hypothetical protein